LRYSHFRMHDDHRNATPITASCIPFKQPFSSHEYVERNFDDTDAIRRLFSLARSEGALTLMVEAICPKGMILDENEEIQLYYRGYRMPELQRISFWKTSFIDDNGACEDDDCLGYAILKRDVVTSKNKYDCWHVFEAVFRKYPHEHNCVPRVATYAVRLGSKTIHIEGLLYAQQNGLNKTCAQVALRSLISRINGGDVSYREINAIAAQNSHLFRPDGGLNQPQIEAVLSGFGIRFRKIDYTKGCRISRKRVRRAFPYQKFIYSGIESGCGALLGFRLSGPGHRNEGHVIPFYGHTFNKDTWAPHADQSYFLVDKNLRYIPSSLWTSSFLGHDDNFGPNFCVPRLYVPPEQVDFVVELLYDGIADSGTIAEVNSLPFLHSVLRSAVLAEPDLKHNTWLRRLYVSAVQYNQVVLRAIAIDKNSFIRHVSTERDWNGNPESQTAISVLNNELPEKLWVVEVSVPQLFPANQRRLGEIVLNGSVGSNPYTTDNSSFLYARVPGLYLFQSSENEARNFITVPSNITSHIPVLRL